MAPTPDPPKFADQQVVQPQPIPITWLVANADFPSPDGTTVRLVVIDTYGQFGMHRYFVEPGAARALIARLEGAVKLAENKGVQVVQGHQALTIAEAARKPNRAERRHPGNGR